MISEGWIWNMPAPIQRLAPLTSMPMPGTRTTKQRKNDAEQDQRREPAHDRDPAAGEQLHARPSPTAPKSTVRLR